MADKKEGFGVNTTPAAANGPPVLFETPDYHVRVGRLSSGPEGTAPELLVRYIIQHKKQGVVYGTAAGLGQAIAHCVQAQLELTNAIEGAKEYEARNYSIEKKHGPELPDFGVN
jgi:hypothetical protein